MFEKHGVRLGSGVTSAVAGAPPPIPEAMGRLVEVVQELSFAHDLATVMKIVRAAARELTGADGATFVLRDGDQCFYAEENAISPLWKGLRFPMSLCISGWVMLNRQSTVIEDIYTDDRIPAEAYRPTFVKSLVMVPIRTQDPVGAIGNYWARPYRATPEQVGLLQALADTTAVALSNIQIYTELQQKTRDLTALMDAAPVAIVSLRPDGTPWTWNQATTDLFGTDPCLQSDGCLSGIDANSSAAFLRILDIIRAGSAVSAETLKGRHSNGNSIDLRLSAAPVAGEDGRLRAILLVAENETERNRIERQFLHAQKMEAVGQLTGGIAHDFNNLLGILIGNLDLIRDRIEADPDTLELVDAALEAGLRGAELNKRLLAFSRRQALQPEEVNVNAAVTNMVKLLRRSLGERVEVRLACGEDIWPVTVDPVQLETAVVNLCVNARDAMPQGGVVTIETHNALIDAEYAAAHIELTPGDYAMVAISDTGTGMSPDILAKVFDPFFTTKPVGRGTGLGLSMVYGFMKQSGGHVNVYSEPGRGTTIRLYLPRQTEGGAAARAVSNSEIVPRSARNELILVVEDNPDMRRITARQLTELGYRVVEAENADQAAAEIEGGLNPDLVFTDVIMPGSMDGIVLADRLQLSHPLLPILLTSGFTERAVHEARRQEGRLPFPMLSKPYRRDDLARAVRQVLGSDKGGARS